MDRRFTPPVSDGMPFGMPAGNGPTSSNWQSSTFADGIPLGGPRPTPKLPELEDGKSGGGSGGNGGNSNGGVGGYEPAPGPEVSPSKAEKVNKRVSSMLQFEGPRGRATRAAVWLRYVAFLLEILLLSALTEAFTSGVPKANGAGQWMLFAVSVVLVSGALATLRHPNERNKIIKEARHYILGIMVRAGTAIGALIWGTKGLFDDMTQDAFSAVLVNALPIVYFCTVFLPALVFIKMVFGLGQLNRSMEDNQKLVERYTRQDGYQR